MFPRIPVYREEIVNGILMEIATDQSWCLLRLKVGVQDSSLQSVACGLGKR